MTTTEQNIQTATALYTEHFGEKAAKRNERRIAVLAGLIGQYGARNVTGLEEISTDMAGMMQLKEDPTVCVLGTTSATSRRILVVVAHYRSEQDDIVPAALAAVVEAPAAVTPQTVAAAITPAPRPRRSRGQLWQECFCGTEPVCAGCEKCEWHCTCPLPDMAVAGEIYGGAE